jgi:hypothetical protein
MGTIKYQKIKKSKIKNQKSKIKNQKSKIKNQKSKIKFTTIMRQAIVLQIGTLSRILLLLS